jgi:hypothetical protein
LKILNGFEVGKKKKANDWSAGILACPIAAGNRKKFRLLSRLKAIEVFQFALGTLTLRFVCYTLRQARMPALQSLSC